LAAGRFLGTVAFLTRCTNGATKASSDSEFVPMGFSKRRMGLNAKPLPSKSRATLGLRSRGAQVFG
jgi:hypothetical protein